MVISVQILKFTLEHAMKGQRMEYRYSSPLSLTLALDAMGGQLHASAALTPGKRPSTQYTESWVGERKTSPQPGVHPTTVQPVVSRYTDNVIPAQNNNNNNNNNNNTTASFFVTDF
jgi:hypothetical protein